MQPPVGRLLRSVVWRLRDAGLSAIRPTLRVRAPAICVECSADVSAGEQPHGNDGRRAQAALHALLGVLDRKARSAMASPPPVMGRVLAGCTLRAGHVETRLTFCPGLRWTSPKFLPKRICCLQLRMTERRCLPAARTDRQTRCRSSPCLPCRTRRKWSCPETPAASGHPRSCCDAWRPRWRS